MTSHNIYNAFIMPYCVDAVDSIATSAASLQKDPDSAPLGSPVGSARLSYAMKSAGFIYGDWKDRMKPYRKIACILLDVKAVMENYSANDGARKELANLITSTQPQTASRSQIP